jgi:O-antigen biosynthesis protein
MRLLAGRQMTQRREPTISELQSLPFDLYERYELTRRLLSALNLMGGEALRILDVGGHSSPLKHFLPREWIVLADPQPKGSLTHLPPLCDAYVQGNGSRLPFRDAAFDVVTAHDTLEHVEAGERPAFLAELCRVAREFVIINGPVREPAVVQAERRLASFLQKVGANSPYLQEHLRLGLPKREDIEGIIGDAGYSFLEIENGNLWVWLALNSAKNYLQTSSGNEDLGRAVDEMANRVLCLRDIRGTGYRRAYLVAKQERGPEILDKARRDLRWEPVVEDQEVLSEALRAMEDQVALVRRGDNQYGDPANVEPLLRTMGHIVLATVAPHLVAQENLERLLKAMEEERVGLGPRLSTRFRGAVRRYVERSAPWGTRKRSVVLAPLRARRVLRTKGFGALTRYMFSPSRWAPPLRHPALPSGEAFEQTWPGDEGYEVWLRTLVLSPQRLRAMRRSVSRLRYRPTISVVVPVHDPEPDWLRDALESVTSQVYPGWELCIADDASTHPRVRDLLRRYEGHSRVKVTYLDRNLGITGASNAALSLATGEFVGFLDHDDILKPNALFEVVKLLNETPSLDFVYSDQDKQELDGRLTGTFFKPGWSPDLLMSVNYVTHFSVYRRTLLQELGGFREGFEGSQDYDLALRLSEATDRIGHVPLPLYSWRKVPGSAAVSIDEKDYAWEAGARALAEAARRRGHEADVVPALAPYRYRTRYAIRGDPKVTIVIPTRDKTRLLRKCVESIRASTYSNLEIAVIDNQSEQPATLEYLASFDGVVVRYPHPFNFSRVINFAAREVGDTDFLLFLNNDMEVITEDWIEALVEHGQRSEVAAVGGRLLFPDGRPQHEGIMVGRRGGLPGNIDHRGTYDMGLTIRNCAAVTFACALVRPEIFFGLGGLDERFQIGYQDVDFCLRAGEKGYWIVYTPHALLYHDEGGTRGRKGRTHPEEDTRLFLERWKGYRDPFYNPNFDPDRLFSLNVDPVRMPHLRVKPERR